MRTLLSLFFLYFLVCGQIVQGNEIRSRAEPLSEADSYSVYLGPSLGATTLSTSDGEGGHDSEFSYGLQAFIVRHQLALGLSYSTYTLPDSGIPQMTVSGRNHAVTLEGRFRVWDQNYSPYFLAGAGSLFQSLSTNIMGQTETVFSNYFLYDLGLGLLGQLSERWGFDVNFKFHQYSNVVGFNYLASLGYFF